MRNAADRATRSRFVRAVATARSASATVAVDGAGGAIVGTVTLVGRVEGVAETPMGTAPRAPADGRVVGVTDLAVAFAVTAGRAGTLVRAVEGRVVAVGVVAALLTPTLANVDPTLNATAPTTTARVDNGTSNPLRPALLVVIVFSITPPSSGGQGSFDLRTLS